MAEKTLEQTTGKMAFEVVITDVSQPAAVRAAVSSLEHAIDALIMNTGTVGNRTNITCSLAVEAVNQIRFISGSVSVIGTGS